MHECSGAERQRSFQQIPRGTSDEQNMGNATTLVTWAGNSIYALQAFDALWGAYCVIVIWRTLSRVRFRNEDAQSEFLDSLEDSLEAGDFDGARQLCEGDARAIPRLALLAIENRDLGYSKVRQLVADRFGRDILADLEYRMTWVYTVIKSAPMLGLLGTVLGMMAAFSKLGGGQKVDATQLADDIALALITTFVGLTIAIPLSLVAAAIVIRTRKMEDLAGAGMNRIMESLKSALADVPVGGR
jgi:biopolymer transport protein ExbB/TolQ